MSDLTLNDVKAKREAEVAEKNEAIRVERKNGLLEQLASVETRLTTYVENLTDRRAALKAQKTTAKQFLDVIKARADDEDLEVEEIENLLHSIDAALVAGQNGFANGGHVGLCKGNETIVVNVTGEEVPESITNAIREVIRQGKGRGRRAG